CLGFICCLRGTDCRDDFINMIKRNLESLEDVGTITGFPKLKLGPTTHDSLAMLDVLGQDILDSKHARLDTVNQCQHIVVECRLEWREVMQLVPELLWVRVVFEVYDDTDTPACAFITNVRDTRHLLITD